MILLFDVGNTTVGVGFAFDQKIVNSFRLNTNLKKTADEYFIDLKQLIEIKDITGVAISSVVPAMTRILEELSIRFLGIHPLIVQPKTRTGINIITDHPKEVGADLICAAAGVDSEKSTLVIDLGTATKYIYVKKSSIRGVIITPGIKVSIKALVGNTALLPEIDIDVPKKVLGTNTIECMQSGVTYGTAVQVDGLIELIKKEVNEEFNIIITGGLAPIIIPLIKHEVFYDNNIVYKGLISIYYRNQH
ncbi:MAG: type III pantothenate kinase [Acholeplasma sp.]|nr:type III pantothenate kinase [Acholeplasma sp.]